MTKRIQKLFMAVAALAALAVGGSAIATAQTTSHSKAPAAKSTHTSTSKTARTGEAPGTEKPDAAEQPGSESANESANESPADSDGPGGHADEPGNASADHQFQGQE